MRWTQSARLTGARDADGEVVWSRHRDAGVKLRGSIRAATVARKPVHRGEHEGTRKTIAQGKPGCLRWTCMLVCALFYAHCTRDRGCSVHPAFPAPSCCFGGWQSTQSPGGSRRGNAETRPHRCLTFESEVCEEPTGRANAPAEIVGWVSDSVTHPVVRGSGGLRLAANLTAS
jgi:hypothetical protein